MSKFALAKVLKKNQMSQYKLAKLLGVTTADVYRWTRSNYNPTLKTMLMLSEALDMPIERFIEGNKPKRRKGRKS